MKFFSTRTLVLMAMLVVSVFAFSGEADAGPIVRLVQKIRANCQARQQARQEARHGGGAAGCAAGSSPSQPTPAERRRTYSVLKSFRAPCIDGFCPVQ